MLKQINKNFELKNFLNNKLILSFFLWLSSIGLFDLILFLKQKDNKFFTNIELVFLSLVVVTGVVCFIYFIILLEKYFHLKYHRVKASIFSSFSFIFFLIFGIGLLVSPFILTNKNKVQEGIKPIEASKNTLISSGLKLGSKNDQVKVLQAAFSIDKSLYQSGLISGYYGNLTKQAVINFQERYNLPATGEIDQQTADKFNEVYGSHPAEHYLNLVPTSSTVYVPSTNNSQQNSNLNSNSESLVDCIIGTKCGSFKTTRSDCMTYSYCCEIGDRHIPVRTLDECTRSQNAYNNSTSNNQPQQNKVPIVMPHNGITFYCDPSIKDQIISASSLIIEANKKLEECLNKNRALTDTCVNLCSGRSDSIQCIDDCYYKPFSGSNDLSKACYDANKPYGESWRNLLDNYCK